MGQVPVHSLGYSLEKSARNQWRQEAQRVTFTRAESAKRIQNGPLESLRIAGGQEAAVNESLFSNIFIEKKDSSYASVVGIQGFPVFSLMQDISEKC